MPLSNSLPGPVLAAWLNKLIEALVSPDRCRAVSHSSGKFADPRFIDRLEQISGTIDHLVFDLSFMPNFPEMRQALAETPTEVVDGFIARTFIRISELETETAELLCEGQPDIRAAMRILLIRDPAVRAGIGTPQ